MEAVMQEIWKWPIDSLTNKIEMPGGSKVLAVQMQGDHFMLWAEVYPGELKVTRTFKLIPTGGRFRRTREWTYLATVQSNNGLVFHVYEDGSAAL